MLFFNAAAITGKARYIGKANRNCRFNAAAINCRFKVLRNNQEKAELRNEGEVIEALPSATFRVKLDNGKEVLAHLSGRLRMNYIRILTGDRVIVESSPYDEKRGRIIRRL